MPELRRRRILITGGAGFIAGHLSEHLVREAGTELVLVDDFSRGRRDDDFVALIRRDRVRCIDADLTEPGSYRLLGQGYDEVYHCAAVVGVRNAVERPQEVLRVNALSTVFLLDWLVRGGGRRLLFASTSEAYAWTQQFYPLPVPTPEDVPLALTDLTNPRIAYAGSKMHGELLVTQYCRQAEVPFSIVRYHNVYGPRMGFDHVIPQIYERAASGQNPLVVYSAEHRRAFCYISDAVVATIAAARRPEAVGRTINIGNDHCEVTIAELAARVLAVSGIAADLRPEPDPNDPIARRCPDVSRARSLLGFDPVVGLDEGLRLTLTWYAQHAATRPAVRV